ncbi:MAG: CopY/TcrY family copper transport repressor, partial [Enterococcus hulanensis]
SHICAKRIGETIADLVAEAELTDADVEMIKEQLVRKQTVEKIECNCIPGQCECNHHK